MAANVELSTVMLIGNQKGRSEVEVGQVDTVVEYGSVDWAATDDCGEKLPAVSCLSPVSPKTTRFHGPSRTPCRAEPAASATAPQKPKIVTTSL